MNQHYSEFLKYLELEDKEKCVNFVLQKLDSNEMDVVAIYEQLLTPGLNNIACDIKNSKLCIWKEHVRSGIVRTIIECCFPFILKELERTQVAKSNTTVIVICPDGEYHELGAKMVADFFTLQGFQSIFVGSSTPKDEFVDLIEFINPSIVAISVTNYYNLVSAKKTIEKIREKFGHTTKIMVGGNAFKNNSGAVKDIDADLFLTSYADIQKLSLGGTQI